MSSIAFDDDGHPLDWVFAALINKILVAEAKQRVEKHIETCERCQKRKTDFDPKQSDPISSTLLPHKNE